MAHWIHKLGISDECDLNYGKCSSCGAVFYTSGEEIIDESYKYCPWCGAKMDDIVDELPEIEEDTDISEPDEYPTKEELEGEAYWANVGDYED